jgi:hypothetical protein
VRAAADSNGDGTLDATELAALRANLRERVQNYTFDDPTLEP